ncbi:MAG: hypothetical protein HRT87_10270 [Legionellales bacterium]|nr:hypothetical protein [Legionellales bacterium]
MSYGLTVFKNKSNEEYKHHQTLIQSKTVEIKKQSLLTNTNMPAGFNKLLLPLPLISNDHSRYNYKYAFSYKISTNNNDGEEFIVICDINLKILYLEINEELKVKAYGLYND